ncbi:nitroreductase family protein [Nitzschia inconspicua]|uniref:Nitroreductase family protein n=1 Tax=Nitzschia inconspicua TaxID=303405 RepID=A0A9K3Q211_9STRA|nr:nitroreductase family protein [Nitzschia inconspicua]
MSSRTPFRSHLLQQWTQQGLRPPAAAIPWLRPSSAAEQRNHYTANHQQDETRRHHTGSTSSSVNSSSGGRDRRSCHTLSSIESSFSWSNGFQDSSSIKTKSIQSRKSTTTTPRHHFAVSFSTVVVRQNAHQVDAAVSSNDGSSNDLPKQFYSLLLSRRTAAKPLVFSTSSDSPDLLGLERKHLCEALDRAVRAAQMAPNHKRTEPFTFTRFWSGSRTAETLADICYQVTLRQKSEPVARKKREKWSRIPAFLVATVHENQQPLLQVDEYDDDDSVYVPLEYTPPMTNRQLEDYASACAGIQNVLLSLHAESIATKWATGPIITTLAFRRLVNAEPTDRIVGLIMVGGKNSTELVGEREEKMTSARRHRRRSLHGDVLVDLP